MEGQAGGVEKAAPSPGKPFVHTFGAKFIEWVAHSILYWPQTGLAFCLARRGFPLSWLPFGMSMAGHMVLAYRHFFLD
jgi:hypothetical protein